MQTEQGRKIWKSPQGVSLLGNMLAGKTPNAQDRKVLDALKKSGPPSQEFVDKAKKTG